MFERVFAIALWAVAGVMAVSAFYGVVKGRIFGFGGEHRHDMEIVWWSLAENPGYFWLTFGVNVAVCLFCMYVATRLMRGTA